MKLKDHLPDITALVLGMAITLLVRGYQFGQSNHTVYLLDAMRVNDPSLLKNDWFVSHTYQYHFVFTQVTALLDRAGILRPAFLVGYLLLVIVWHLAWLGIAKAVGLSRKAYLLSVIFFFLSAGGLGLGVYDFIQDASFLPSNIANVAMLCGVYFFILGRGGMAGLMFGVAGFFHLNHAVVGIGLWGVLLIFEARVRVDRSVPSARPLRGQFGGTVALIALCLANVLPAAQVALRIHDRMPLGDFVDLFVRLRHPHHYDPSAWPWALWASFLWPIPLAFAAGFRSKDLAIRRARRFGYLFCLIVATGLILAGAWYVSETMVQLSLSRFSIYLKLLTCLGAAAVVERFASNRTVRHVMALTMTLAGPLAFVVAVGLARDNHMLRQFLADNANVLVSVWAAILLAGLLALEYPLRLSAASAGVVCVAIIALLIFERHHLGLRVASTAGDPPDYLAVCDYARAHTPKDAVFLVPPNEEQFRLRGERAIVINFKGVPQFSGELVEWRTRLCVIYDVPDLKFLPRRFDLTLRALGDRYAALPPRHLIEAARMYRARYVVTTGTFSLPAPAKLIFEKGIYHLYDVRPQAG